MRKRRSKTQLNPGLETELKPAEDDKGRGKRTQINLDYVKEHKGIVGYILRNATSAAIELKDPTKIIDYAILSSSAIEAGEKLSSTFDLGEVESVIVEGKEVKVLNFSKNGKKISIFMERNVDHDEIYRRIA